ncbi:MAG: sulfite exporter TauE/SafE family protein [Patescibacteria group bacterium]
MNKYLFHVSGTHCNSCKILIENIIGKQPGVSKAVFDLGKQHLTVEGEISDSPETLVAAWSKLLGPHQYHLHLEKQKETKELKSVAYAIPLGLIILGLFFLLQRSGLMNFGFAEELSPWTAFLIGVIASLTTCLAVVGGLVLSLSAKISQEVSTTRPLVLFHTGRIIGFTILGGILGAVGEVIAINNTVMVILGITTSLIMIILGINLLDIFHITRRFQFALPRRLYDYLIKIEAGFFAPFIIGVATFFLPCGFTQSMQLAALSCGTSLRGAAIMGMFALGTFPMLALISFGSFRFARTKYAPLFFKTAGIVVIGFGLLSLLAGLAALGIIRPLFNI